MSGLFHTNDLEDSLAIDLRAGEIDLVVQIEDDYDSCPKRNPCY